MAGCYNSHFIGEEIRHREIVHCNQDHTAKEVEIEFEIRLWASRTCPFTSPPGSQPHELLLSMLELLLLPLHHSPERSQVVIFKAQI